MGGKLFVLFFLVIFALSFVPQTYAADACVICRYVANVIEGFIEENKTEAEIIEVLDQICSIAPSSLKPECYSFLAQEVPAIITYMLNNENPGTVCGQLGFCPMFSADGGQDVGKDIKYNRRHA